MKKTLLAAALALGFAGVAQAETSVTLYGIIDGGVGYTRFKHDSGLKATRTGLYDSVQSGNRWGLRGSEDLGNGLKAIFQLENGFSLATGKDAQSGRMFGRQAWFGLAGDSWGMLKLGRQHNMASEHLGGIASPFGDAFKEAHIGASFTSMGTVRVDNMISYTTPNFSGFRFGVGYSFNTNDDQSWDVKGLPAGVTNPDDLNRKLITTALVYNNGPLAVGASYDQLDQETWDSKVKAWNLVGSYDFEVVKLHLAFGQERKGSLGSRLADFDVDSFGVSSGYIADSYKANNYAVGVSAPVGAGRLMAGWQSSRLSSGAFKDSREEKSQNLYSVGYTYPFSKRTNVYAVGTYGDGYGFTDTDVTQVIVGVRHQF